MTEEEKYNVRYTCNCTHELEPQKVEGIYTGFHHPTGRQFPCPEHKEVTN